MLYAEDIIARNATFGGGASCYMWWLLHYNIFQSIMVSVVSKRDIMELKAFINGLAARLLVNMQFWRAAAYAYVI